MKLLLALLVVGLFPSKLLSRSTATNAAVVNSSANNHSNTVRRDMSLDGGLEAEPSQHGDEPNEVYPKTQSRKKRTIDIALISEILAAKVALLKDGGTLLEKLFKFKEPFLELLKSLLESFAL